MKSKKLTVSVVTMDESTPILNTVNEDNDINNDNNNINQNKSNDVMEGCKECVKAVPWTLIGVIFAIATTLTIVFSSPTKMVINETKKQTFFSDNNKSILKRVPLGPYQLIERQDSKTFFNYYEFYDGPDSLGSAGRNVYVSRNTAMKLGLTDPISKKDDEHNDDDGEEEEFVYIHSTPPEGGNGGLRSSVRLEGKRRFNRGLFILDLRHMPAGCGVWPAFWLTDEANWPDNGEIDIVEGINYQSVAKTALHTSDKCDMYSHVPYWVKTGTWEWSTGIPNTYSGEADYKTVKESDNCWEKASHQWYNQGCVGVSDQEGTLGVPLNKAGGGVFALELDPANGYIRSWVFTPHDTTPQNILDAIRTSTQKPKERIEPKVDEWGLPYAYFRIGEGSGCTANHFKRMRIVFNLAFCGTVAGNRYFRDCPKDITSMFNVSNDAVASCNAYMDSNPMEVEDEAYWKIKGLYVYERELIDQKEEEQEQQQEEEMP